MSSTNSSKFGLVSLLMRPLVLFRRKQKGRVMALDQMAPLDEGNLEDNHDDDDYGDVEDNGNDNNNIAVALEAGGGGGDSSSSSKDQSLVGSPKSSLNIGPLPLYGVNLKFLKRILAFTRKFDPDFEMTVGQVNEKVIIPMTLSTKLSAAMYLKNNYFDTPEPRVSTSFSGSFSMKADVYVVYARTQTFYDLINCLECYTETHVKEGQTRDDIYFWIDIFSTNQYIDLTEKWLMKVNYQIIKKIDEVCLVMMPFEQAEPYSRSWCLYELFVASLLKKKLCFQFKKSARLDFEKNVYNSYNYLKDTVVPRDKVSLENSICFSETELAQILSVLSAMHPDKIPGVNKAIHDYLLDQFYDRCIASVSAHLLHLAEEILKLQHQYSTNNVCLEMVASNNARDPSNLNTLPLQLEETTGMITLATIYYHKNDVGRAISTYLSLLDTHSTVLNHEHPSLGAVYNNLAVFYKRIGDLYHSKLYYKKSLRLKKVLYGKHHQSLITTNINLALLQKALGKLQSAKSILVQVFSDLETTYGSKCQESIKVVEMIIEICIDLDETRDAIAFLKLCMDLHMQYSGQLHPDTVNVYESLGSMIARSGDTEAAALILEQSLATRMKLYGPGHLSTQDTLMRLAVIKLKLRDFSASQSLFSRVYSFIESKQAYDSKDRFCIESLGDIDAELLKFNKSVVYYEKTFESCRKLLGEHVDTFRVAYKLADSYLMLKQYDQCEDLFKFSFEGRLKLLGETHCSTLESKFGLANSLVTLLRYREALPIYSELLLTFDRLYGVESSQSVDTLAALGVIYQKLGDVESAKLTYERLIRNFESTVGKDSAEAKEYSELLFLVTHPNK